MSISRYFIYKYPLRKDRTFDHVPYYWWWEYLRRVPDYGRSHRLYRDFGELGDDFYAWWRVHGVELFAEQLPTQTKVLFKMEGELPNDSIALIVPALHPSMTADELVKKFRQAVKPHIGRGSTSKYPLYTNPDTDGLRTTLAVYDRRMSNPRLTSYEIAEQLHNQGKVMFSKRQLIKKGDTPATIRDKKNSMKPAVSRYLRHAKGYIKNVGEGVFPKKS